MELSSLSVTLLLTVLFHCGRTQGKPRLRVDPQSSVYTGDTVTLSCEPPYQFTDWYFHWKKDFHYLQPPHDQSTYSITVSHPGETEFSCIAQRGDYQSEDSDPVRITVRGDSAAQPSDVTYAQIATKKNRRGNNEGVTRPNDVTYSQIQMKNLEHHEKGL
ncbi:hypothetical protein MHYP_G00351350 [Metynnis hypsauchen]